TDQHRPPDPQQVDTDSLFKSVHLTQMTPEKENPKEQKPWEHLQISPEETLRAFSGFFFVSDGVMKLTQQTTGSTFSS
ncbi:Tubulin--tyrosine ligase-like protein 12, partial [Dissostichus eleginoides]